MRILYMDCFLGFDAQMLLGALIDAGASVEIIRKDFENAGISADISISNTLRCSISCKRAEEPIEPIQLTPLSAHAYAKKRRALFTLGIKEISERTPKPDDQPDHREKFLNEKIGRN